MITHAIHQKLIPGATAVLLFLAAIAPIVLTTPAIAQEFGFGGDIALTYIPGSSHKLYQINGDCDWVEWDATLSSKTPTCNPTISQTLTRADVLGDGLGASFEHDGSLIVLFGDTIGGTPYYSKWARISNSYMWQAGDPIARSTTQHAEDGLLLNFFLTGTAPTVHALPVQPPPQEPGDIPVDMGAFDIPNAGISLDGQIYIICSTGTTVDINGNPDYSGDYSVLAGFDETNETFSSGRTISRVADGGHFVYMGLYEAPPWSLGEPLGGWIEPMVVMFGLGVYRDSNIYLSMIPKSQFWSGVDWQGNSSTLYFTGMGHGHPEWSLNETDAVPVVTDLDPSSPTIGNFSVFYSDQLGLWLMTFDGGRNSTSTTGFYFTYATQPWGPWTTPQFFYNDCRDGGYGNFIFYYTDKAHNDCPSALPAGTTTFPASAGPTGPMIGSNDPFTSRGAAFAPQMIQRFTEMDGNTLKIFYNLSTWNPYAVVLMESDFEITRTH
jgi:hypothetical protein